MWSLLWSIIGWGLIAFLVLIFIGAIGERDYGTGILFLVIAVLVWYFFLRSPSSPPQNSAAVMSFPRETSMNQTQTPNQEQSTYRSRRERYNTGVIKRPVIKINI